MTNQLTNNKKYFIIINSDFIGDILLTSSLIQNIKRLYENSSIIMITTSKKVIDVAMNLEFVDDTIVWERKGKHNGISGMIKFAKEFPYKNIFAVIPIYSNDRLVILARLLRPTFVLSSAEKRISKLLMKSKFLIKNKPEFTVQEMDTNALSGLTKEKLINYPIKFNPPKEISPHLRNLKNQEYIVLCPITSKKEKDIKFETIKEIIEYSNKKVIFLGAGETAKKLSKQLKKFELDNLIDLTNKTTIPEASQIMQFSQGVISADTGLLHLACGINKEVVEIIYDVKLYKYIPDTELYKISVLYNEYRGKVILNTLNGLTQWEIYERYRYRWFTSTKFKKLEI